MISRRWPTRCPSRCEGASSTWYRKTAARSRPCARSPDMRVLVTGGAGYIGSVVVEELAAAGAEEIVVLDDLSSGHTAAVPAPVELYRGDIGDRALLGQICRAHRVDAVVHMAASS